MRSAVMGCALFVLLLCMVLPVLAEPGHVIRSCDLMDEPYRDANVLTSLEEGAAIEILKRKGGWLNISVGEQAGWVRMSKIRKGEAAAAPDSGTEASGVLELASGRAGTGNVVATTGVRGLSEEELKEAQFNAVEIKKLESFAVPEKQARNFARNGKLVARQLEFLPDAVE
ncbi:SH3 domain-containing protein [Pseudomonadota bacterium]